MRKVEIYPSIKTGVIDGVTDGLSLLDSTMDDWEDERFRAGTYHFLLKDKFGDYPHWGESDIYDMAQAGVSNDHIAAEWSCALDVYQDSIGGAAGVLSRLRKLDVHRPDINEHTVAH